MTNTPEPPIPVSLDECCKAFEAWASRSNYDLELLDEPIESRRYCYPNTEEAWDVWQAALASRAQPSPESLCRDCGGCAYQHAANCPIYGLEQSESSVSAPPNPWGRDYPHQGDCENRLPRCICVVRSEISVVDGAVEQCAKMMFDCLMQGDEQFGDTRQQVRDWLRNGAKKIIATITSQPEPVSVDLAARALKVRMEDMLKIGEIKASDCIWWSEFKTLAKAVLDAAGVPYVD